jgi:GTP-binding protein Era
VSEVPIESFKSGYVAIIGRPNVGKSTLINNVLGQKLCITSRRPQTTRHRILGIKTTKTSQLIYVDTPGLHPDNKRAMNRYLNRAAAGSIGGVDVILFLIEGLVWTDDDALVLDRLRSHAQAPVILVINKVDKLEDKGELLPQIEKLSVEFEFAGIVPISARRGQNVDTLEKTVLKFMPEGELIYPEEQFTDRSSRFLASELVREKLFRHLGQELPYSLTVEIEEFDEQDPKMLRIGAVIYVERAGQKGIVIGKGGELLKSIGKEARIEMQSLFDTKVFLRLWVKVRDGWSDNERMLQNLGYKDEL